MKIHCINLLLAGAALMASCATHARGQQLEPALGIIEQAVVTGEIPGAAVLIMKDGQTLATRAFGTCDLETNRPFRIDTICWIASLTKPVTAAAAMTLVDQGRLSLDDTVEKYLTAFRSQTTDDGQHYPITIRQLMCHASGIQSSVPLRPSFFFEQPWYRRSLAEVSVAIAKTKLIFQPGQQVQYSNAAPYVLGRIIELQAKQPFGDYVRDKILKPLSMTDTGFSISRTNAARAALVYRQQGNDRIVFCRYDPNWEVRMTMPDGGLFSTPHDFARFANSFLKNQDEILSQESVKEMLSEQADGYGLAWILDQDGQFSHWGSSGTLVWGDRRTNTIGVVFFQVQDQKKVDLIQRRFRDAVTLAMAR